MQAHTIYLCSFKGLCKVTSAIEANTLHNSGCTGPVPSKLTEGGTHLLTCHLVIVKGEGVNFPQFIVIHAVKGFGIVNKAEIDVFLELSCFFHDPMDVGNLISSSSAFYKTNLNIWKFTVHVLLKRGLENFEHYFTSM